MADEKVSSLTKRFEKIGSQLTDKSTTKHWDLSHCIGKDPNGKYSIILSRDDLSHLDGTELLKTSQFLFSWSYVGNGKYLPKFFYIIGCNPNISTNVHICINNQFVADELKFPKIQNVNCLSVHLQCDLSSESTENLSACLSKMFYKCTNLTTFLLLGHDHKIGGNSEVLYNFPKTLSSLEFDSVQFSNEILKNMFENSTEFPENLTLVLSDQTVCQFRILMRIFATKPRISSLTLAKVNLDTTSEANILTELKRWHCLYHLGLQSGKTNKGRSGQTAGYLETKCKFEKLGSLVHFLLAK